MYTNLIVLSYCGTEAFLWYIFNLCSNKKNLYAITDEAFTCIRAHDTHTLINLKQHSI